MIFMMKGKKVLSALLAGVMSISCLGMNAFAAMDANDYASIYTDLNEAALQNWDYQILLDIQLSGISVDEDALTFSEPYYSYDFYNMEMRENFYWRIVFENDQIIGISSAAVSQGITAAQWTSGDFEYLAEGLKDDAKILFGSAIVNAFPCCLIYVGGTFYTHSTIALEAGETDLVFGEIPYSEPYWTDTPEDAVGGLLPEGATTTTAAPVEYVPMTGDVNMDGKVSLSDIVLVNRFTAGAIQLNEEQIDAADCCADGFINTSDITVLLQYILEQVDALPVIPE